MGVVVITDEGGTPATPADGAALFSVTGTLKYRDESGTVHEIVTDNNAALGSGVITNTMLATDVKVGSLAALTTTEKASVVGAINEVDANADAAAALVGTLASLTTTAKTSAVAAINEVDANADAANTAIGTLASLTTTAKTSAVAAINELDGEIGDLSTLDTTEQGSIVGAINELAGATVDLTALPLGNLVFDPYNLEILPGQNFGGLRKRWADNSTKLVRVSGDTDNPFGGITLRLPNGTQYAGKIIHCDEAGLKEDDIIYASATVRGASGTARLYIYWSSAVIGGTPTSLGYTQITLDGSVQTITKSATIPATAKRIEFWVYRATGTADIDIYALWATNGAATSYPVASAPTARRQTNVMWDSLNRLIAINADFGGRTRWRNASTGVSLIAPDANNPFGGNTIRLDAARQYFAKLVYPDECGLKAGDLVTFSALVNGASGNCRIYIYLYNAVSGGSVLGNSDNTLIMDGTAKIIGVSRTLATGTKRIEVWIYRSSGSADIDVYGMWGGPEEANALGYAMDEAIVAEVLAARGSESSIADRLTAIETETSVLSPYPAAQLAYGRHLLRSWQAALAKIRAADGTTQAVIAWLGDSWINTGSRLHTPLKTLLQAEYGNAGAGYCSASTTPALPAGVTRNRAGTWTDRSRLTTPKGHGPDLFDAITTDAATPASVDWTSTATDFVLLYLQQADGGSFRWNIDGGSWTTVNTDDTPTELGTVAITGLSNASHVLTVEVVTAGTAGVCIFGVDCRLSGNGVRIHKLGATGSSAASWTAHPEPTVLAATIAALLPNVVAVTLGTNDHSDDVAPATFATSIETLLATAIGSLDAQALIVAPADNGNTAVYEMQDYIDALRASAVAEGYAMLDSLLLLGDYASADARGLYDDASHINGTAGRIVTGTALEELLYLP